MRYETDEEEGVGMGGVKIEPKLEKGTEKIKMKGGKGV